MFRYMSERRGVKEISFEIGVEIGRGKGKNV